MGVYKTVNGAYRYSLMPTYYVKGCSPLALPLGELSPQVTERVLALPLGELSPQVTERVLQPFSNDKINLCTHHENPCLYPGWRIAESPTQETSGIENVPHHKQAPEVHNVASHPIQ